MTKVIRYSLNLTVLIALSFGLSAAQVQCQQAEARPSLDGLQTQINALAPGSLRVFDALGEEIGLLVRFGDSLRVYLESIGASIFLDSEGFLIVESPGGQIIYEGFGLSGSGIRTTEVRCKAHRGGGAILRWSPGALH